MHSRLIPCHVLTAGCRDLTQFCWWLPQEFDAFLAALAPVLGRLSYAFARIVLVCEGGAGFQAQVWERVAGLALLKAS